MIFAQIPQEAYTRIANDKMFRIYAIVQIEMFESGCGVCRLPVGELAKKHHQNPDSFSRYVKKMIGDGLLIKVVGGIITNSFNTTDEKSVNEENELTNNQFTDEKSVEELTKNQLPTDEKSGTEIAINDLDLKEDFNKNSLSPREREKRRGLTVDEAAALLDADPNLPAENPSPTRAIEIWREIFPTAYLDGEVLKDFAKILPEVEESVWRQNLLDWRISRWQASNISGQVRRYKGELKNWLKEQQNGGTNGNGTNRENGNGHNPQQTNGSAKPANFEISQSRDYSDFEGFDPIAAFGEKT